MKEYRVQRKVVFYEEAYIEAESEEDVKEKLKTAQLDWDVDFEYNPTIEEIFVFESEDGSDVDDGFELPNPSDYMEEDYVEAMNGCIVFNNKEFNRHVLMNDDEY